MFSFLENALVNVKRKGIANTKFRYSYHLSAQVNGLDIPWVDVMTFALFLGRF